LRKACTEAPESVNLTLGHPKETGTASAVVAERKHCGLLPGRTLPVGRGSDCLFWREIIVSKPFPVKVVKSCRSRLPRWSA